MKEIIKNYSDIFITSSAAIVACGQYYLENIVGLEPCNLCILQKLSAQAVFLIFFFKMIVPKFKYIFDVLGVTVLILGLQLVEGKFIFKICLLINLLVDIVIYRLNFYLTCILFLMHLEKFFREAANVQKSLGFSYI